MAIRRRHPIEEFIFRCDPPILGQGTMMKSRDGEVSTGLVSRDLSENSGKRKERHTSEQS
jgi:hypothetical protein